jgi:toxin FitB
MVPVHRSRGARAGQSPAAASLCRRAPVNYLLDTNVVAEIRRRAADGNVVAWFESVAPEALYLSAIVVGEVRAGIDRLRPRDPAEADVQEAWLDELLATFSDRVLSIDAEVAQEWGRLTARRTLAVEDGLMAATANVHGMTFVTRNAADVAGAGARALNPVGPALIVPDNADLRATLPRNGLRGAEGTSV